MKWKEIIETCAVPIIVYDRQGRVSYINQWFEKVFGWTANEITGKTLDFVPRDQADLAKKFMTTVMAGHTLSNVETKRTTKSQDTIDVRLGAVPLSDEEGNFDKMAFSFQDITELVQSRQETVAADLVKKEFFSNLSQGIRTPLNHALGMTDLLLNTQLDQEQQEFVEILQKSTDTIMTVVNEMLDYPGTDTPRETSDCIGFDLRTLVEKVKEVLAGKAKEKKLDFGFFVHQFVPSLVMGDPGRLRRVLVALCTNAIKFTEKGSVKIQIFLGKEDNKTADIRFEVIDTGIGIAQEQLSRLLDPLARAGGFEIGGTGQGLGMSIKLVQMMGGTIEAKSSPGRGSIFFFTLGFAKQDIEKGKRPGTLSSIQGKKILVVDENSFDRKIFKTLIKDWGCFFDEAVTPEAALTKCRNAKNSTPCFDVILLHKEIKGMGSEALAEKIKAMPGARGMVIIVLASVGKRGDVVRFKNLGVNGYLPKPVRPPELYDCIATALTAEFSGQTEVITRYILNENRKQQVHILLNEPGRINRKMALNILGKSGYRVSAEIDGDRMFESFKTGQYNMILMDIHTPGNMETIQAIRGFEKENKKERVPIIAITDSYLVKDKAGQCNELLDDTLAKPLTPDRLLQTIEKWTWQNEKFLNTQIDGYSQMKSRKGSDTVFDFSSALERAMNDKEFLELLVDTFLAALPGKIDSIKDAVVKEDIPALILLAQSLKESSGSIGAEMIYSAARAIESMGETGDLPLADNRIKQLEIESARFNENISKIEWSKI